MTGPEDLEGMAERSLRPVPPGTVLPCTNPGHGDDCPSRSQAGHLVLPVVDVGPDPQLQRSTIDCPDCASGWVCPEHMPGLSNPHGYDIAEWSATYDAPHHLYPGGGTGYEARQPGPPLPPVLDVAALGPWKNCACGHLMLLHDVEDMDGSNPTCCVEGCNQQGCGGRKETTHANPQGR